MDETHEDFFNQDKYIYEDLCIDHCVEYADTVDGLTLNYVTSDRECTTACQHEYRFLVEAQPYPMTCFDVCPHSSDEEAGMTFWDDPADLVETNGLDP